MNQELGCAVIFASKRNEAKRKQNFFRFDAKKMLFSLVSDLKKSEAKRKWNEAKTKQKSSKKLPLFSLRSEMKRIGSKKLPSFSLRSEMKRNGSDKLPSFSLRRETEAIFFSLRSKKMK
jgi:hypothetical protein